MGCRNTLRLFFGRWASKVRQGALSRTCSRQRTDCPSRNVVPGCGSGRGPHHQRCKMESAARKLPQLEWNPGGPGDARRLRSRLLRDHDRRLHHVSARLHHPVPPPASGRGCSVGAPSPDCRGLRPAQDHNQAVSDTDRPAPQTPQAPGRKACPALTVAVPLRA